MSVLLRRCGCAAQHQRQQRRGGGCCGRVARTLRGLLSAVELRLSDYSSLLPAGWAGAVAEAPPSASSLFAQCEGELVRVRYRWDSRWYGAKLRSKDLDGTYTAVFVDGFIQFGTVEADVWRGNFRASDAAVEDNRVEIVEAEIGQLDTELDIWTAAKVGDAARVAELLAGGAPLNAPEHLPGGNSGRTPLYWACLCGHVATARALLAAGASDADGAAWDAVTAAVGGDGDSNIIASAAADLLHDPDEGIYTEGLEEHPSAGGGEAGGETAAGGGADEGGGPGGLDAIRGLLGTLPNPTCCLERPARTHRNSSEAASVHNDSHNHSKSRELTRRCALGCSCAWPWTAERQRQLRVTLRGGAYLPRGVRLGP